MSNAHGKSGISPTESETTSTVGNFSHGSRETPVSSAAPMAADRSEKAQRHKSDRNGAGGSDSFIVPGKPANKAGQPTAAESVEGRKLAEENTGQTLLDRTQRRDTDGKPFQPRSRGLSGVRQAARKDRKQKFTNLLHHITPGLLRDIALKLLQDFVDEEALVRKDS
jgi:RNA-directed DNA polymerase